MKKVYIDAGHGGYDPGAVGKTGTKESEIARKVCYWAAYYLKKKGYKVKRGRLKDVFQDINYRWKSANAWGADFFICVHMNSADDRTAKGVEVLVHDNNGAKNVISKQICKLISQSTKTLNRGVKVRTNLGVLNWTKMPAILIECDFISHLEIEKKMKTRTWRKNIGKCIADGINL